ncbi:MAG: hypothetical protein ABI614_18840 [Planctomycetota bacterium]
MSRSQIRAGILVTAVVLLGRALHAGEGCDQSCAAEAIADCDFTECSGAWESRDRRDRLWTVTADALFLDRRDPTLAVVMFNQADTDQNLNAADFDFGIGTGFDISAVRQLDACNGVEVRYFRLGSLDSNVSVTTTPGDPLQVNTVRPLITETGTSIEASYESGLDDFELTGRRQVSDWLMLLAGFRYLELDERFQATLPGAATPFNYVAASRNRLYGAQLGGQALLWHGCDSLSIEAVTKAGIYGNHAAQDSVFNTSLVSLPASGVKSSVAFIGELGLSADYRLTDRLSVRGGYQLLWVAGVALATDQLEVSDFISASGIEASGDTLYHGAFVGLEYGW